MYSFLQMMRALHALNWELDKLHRLNRSYNLTTGIPETFMSPIMEASRLTTAVVTLRIVNNSWTLIQNDQQLELYLSIKRKTLSIVTGLEEVVVDETEMMIGWEKIELESMPMPWNLLLWLSRTSGSRNLCWAVLFCVCSYRLERTRIAQIYRNYQHFIL